MVVRKRQLLFVIAVMAVSFALVIGFLVWKRMSQTQNHIVPQSISTKALFPIYAPSRLPEKFVIDPNSYIFKDQVLIFKATDKDNRTIAFTQQSKPSGFDFANFYSQQLLQPKRITNTQYQSYSGRLKGDGSTLLSITTDETWLLVTLPQPLGEADAATIARSVVLQK